MTLPKLRPLFVVLNQIRSRYQRRNEAGNDKSKSDSWKLKKMKLGFATLLLIGIVVNEIVILLLYKLMKEMMKKECMV